MSIQRPRCSLAVLLLVLVLGLPAVAVGQANESDRPTEIETLRTRLADRPEDDPSRFRLARLLAWSGDYDGALVQYARLLARHPRDADYLLGEAQTLAWAGEDEAALARLAEAREQAPDYEAVWQLEASLLARSAAPTAAHRLDELRAAAAQRFPGADWWQVRAAPAPVAETRLEAGFAYEDLTDGRDSWHSEYLRADRRLGDRGAFLLVERNTRFDESDNGAKLGGDLPVGERWRLGGDLGGSPGADFMPRFDGAAHVARSFAGGFGGRYEWRYRDYADATVDTHSLTAERYLGRFRGAYMLSVARLHGGSTTLAHAVTVNFFSSESTRYALTVANGEEAESVAPGVVEETDITSVTLTGRHALLPRLDLSWWVGVHDQGDIYRRRYVGLALSGAL